MEKERPEITASKMQELATKKQQTLRIQDLRAVLNKISEAADSGNLYVELDWIPEQSTRNELESRGFSFYANPNTVIRW